MGGLRGGTERLAELEYIRDPQTGVSTTPALLMIQRTLLRPMYAPLCRACFPKWPNLGYLCWHWEGLIERRDREASRDQTNPHPANYCTRHTIRPRDSARMPAYTIGRTIGRLEPFRTVESRHLGGRGRVKREAMPKA